MVSPLSPGLYFSASVSHGHSTISSSNCPWSWLPGTTYPALFYHWPNCLLRRRQWHPTPVLLLENPMGGGAWWAAVHGVAESWTRLSDFTFTFHLHALEKEMATHSSVLAWRIPETGEPSGLPSMGSRRVRHDWATELKLHLLNQCLWSRNFKKQIYILIIWLYWVWICLQCRRPRFDSWIRRICWRRDRIPTPVFLGFPCGSAGKESACNEGDLGSITGLGRSPGEGNSYALQYSGLENFMGSMRSPWGRKESDTTERLSLSLFSFTGS